MRRMIVGVVLLVVVSGFAPVPPAAPVAAGLHVVTSSLVSPLGVDQGRSAGAEATIEVDPAAPPLPNPAEFRITPALVVRTTRPARVHTGRGSWFLVVDAVGQGAVLPYISSREGWFLVRTPSGGSGWLAAEDAEVTDARDQGFHYHIQPGRWDMLAPNGLQVEIRRVGSGVAQVVLTHIPGSPSVVETGDGTVTVLVSPESQVDLQGALQIGEGGVLAVSVSRRGILIDTEGNPLWRVTVAEGDRVELEFRPGLAGVDATADGWRFRLRGDARPVLRPEVGELVLDLPGGARAPELGNLPPGVALTAVGPEAAPREEAFITAPNAAVPALMPMGGLRLRMPERSPLYALYHPAPEVFELRFLPPGLAGKTIVVDPGHGGPETGAVGVGGTIEKDVNLAVALKLQPLLAEAGAQVIMTRSVDAQTLTPERSQALATLSERTRADLEHRVAMSNAAGVDLYLSIHANGGTAADSGTETYWAVPSLNAVQSRRLAGLVQAELLRALGLLDRGVRQRPFFVIRYADAPSALAEMGFMTYPKEERLLASAAGQQQAAEALLRAVQRYFEP